MEEGINVLEKKIKKPNEKDRVLGLTNAVRWLQFKTCLWRKNTGKVHKEKGLTGKRHGRKNEQAKQLEKEEIKLPNYTDKPDHSRKGGLIK